MKKIYTAVILILSMNTAQALSYNEQKLLYLTIHSSNLLMLCQYPYAAWELVDVGKRLGHQAGYSNEQLGQLHKKILTQIKYRIQIQGRLRDVDCDYAVNFHAYVKRSGLGTGSQGRPSWSPGPAE